MKVLVAMDDSKFSQAALQAVVSQIRPLMPTSVFCMPSHRSPYLHPPKWRRQPMPLSCKIR